VDGRGPATVLLPRILERLGTTEPAALPPWAGRASKGEIAALAPLICEAAESGDWVAAEILEDAAGEMALHAAALARRLGPWMEERGIVFHGGMFRSPLFTENVESALRAHAPGFRVCPAAADAVAGAVRLAEALLEG
jgi:N-acetylglucosamine kinase-like BadF-type ATPase